MKKLQNIEPIKVFEYFEEISQIPRDSKDEKLISDYLVKVGNDLNLEVYQDSFYNVLLRKKDTNLYKDKPGFILQGHMDMVCVKDKDSAHDFSKDPIPLVIKENYLEAKGTTLGADNGIALAYALSLIQEESLKDIPMELLFTTSEEIDLGGALNFEPNILKGQYFINLDSEEEGVLTVGSAGGKEIFISQEFSKEILSNKYIFKITIDGLLGGHSGAEINKYRLNSIKSLNELLTEFNNLSQINIIEIFAGTKDNAIPKDGYVIFTSNKNILKDSNNIFFNFKLKYENFEPTIDLKIEELSNNLYSSELTIDSTNKLMKLINEIPTGVNTMMDEYPETVESSSNLAIIETKENSFSIVVSTRSSDSALLTSLVAKITNISIENNSNFTLSEGYPEWKFQKNSKLREKAIEIYKDMYQKDMVVEVIHAGLECGAIYQSYPNLEIISIGPNLYDVHTTSEKLDIESTKRVYDYLKTLLKNL